jgi:hypothetical protein
VLQRPIIIYALHLFALCSFAVAQPLYDLLAQNVEFFVAHRAGVAEILLLAAVVSFGLPLLLLGLEAIVGLASSRAQRILHIGLVAVLIGAGVLIAINRLAEFSAQLSIGLSLVAGVALAALYVRSEVLQRFCTIASAFAAFFPIYLIGFTPVSSIFRPAHAAESAGIDASTPIVVVVFDEFNLTGLLNERQEIDAVRFPNLAALAKDAWWFRRATAVNPATIKAVPAILSGLTPSPEVVPPSVAGFPNNLFTLLGSDYRFNVMETATELCPRARCRGTGDQFENRFDPKLMASDLSIIYLHALLPVKFASRLLPPTNNGWNGFAASRNSQAADGAEDGEGKGDAYGRKGASRAEAFSSFVSRISPGEKTLDFLHILLPHSPYVYLPNGQSYLGGFEEGTLPNLMWSDNEYLVRMQYQRFLLQAGYVDSLIGDLIKKLKQTGKYEKSLIVMTADHGKAFRPGVSKRTLSKDNAPDILQIPLFVKLPEQKEGKISDRPVSNLDILPTIADVLGSKIPWDVHGYSMIREDFPARDILEIQTRKGPEGQFTFDRQSVTSFPRLSWHLNLVGSETPLTSLRLRGEYSDLLGKSLSILPIEGRQEKTMVSLEALESLNNVDLNAETLPVYWRGEVKGIDKVEQGMPLALALNGVIEAIVPTYSWNDKPFQFSAMIPQTALTAGKNEFRAFLLRQDGTDRRLIELITMASADEFQIVKETDGSQKIVSASGQRVPVAPSRVKGTIGNLKRSEAILEISGWAVDVERKVPAAEVLVFADGRFLYAGKPNIKREDVSKALGSASFDKSGYRFKIPLKAWSGQYSSLRVFGLTQDSQAGELLISPAASEALAGRT